MSFELEWMKEVHRIMLEEDVIKAAHLIEEILDNVKDLPQGWSGKAKVFLNGVPGRGIRYLSKGDMRHMDCPFPPEEGYEETGFGD